jgi:hypothetical protein
MSNSQAAQFYHIMSAEQDVVRERPLNVVHDISVDVSQNSQSRSVGLRVDTGNRMYEYPSKAMIALHIELKPQLVVGEPCLSRQSYMIVSEHGLRPTEACFHGRFVCFVTPRRCSDDQVQYMHDLAPH